MSAICCTVAWERPVKTISAKIPTSLPLKNGPPYGPGEGFFRERRAGGYHCFFARSAQTGPLLLFSHSAAAPEEQIQYRFTLFYAPPWGKTPYRCPEPVFHPRQDPFPCLNKPKTSRNRRFPATAPTRSSLPRMFQNRYLFTIFHKTW